ncbi:MAG: helix-turn-helix transcriptional regulator [Oscillospiraceae bacterium]|nr:helix-turn-helix transcriptional regulator [Oscillospiraceae bacterium]
MGVLFAETLRKLRAEKGISQRQLGKQLFVNHSTVARWETGSRLPDASMVPRLADALGVDANTLFHLAAGSDESPKVILVDDSTVAEKIYVPASSFTPY